MLQCVAVCCSVVQCVAVCCSAMQCVAWSDVALSCRRCCVSFQNDLYDFVQNNLMSYPHKPTNSSLLDFYDIVQNDRTIVFGHEADLREKSSWVYEGARACRCMSVRVRLRVRVCICMWTCVSVYIGCRIKRLID